MKAAGVSRDSPRAVTILAGRRVMSGETRDDKGPVAHLIKMDNPKKRLPFCTLTRNPKLALPTPMRIAPMMMALLEPNICMYYRDQKY